MAISGPEEEIRENVAGEGGEKCMWVQLEHRGSRGGGERGEVLYGGSSERRGLYRYLKLENSENTEFWSSSAGQAENIAGSLISDS